MLNASSVGDSPFFLPEETNYPLSHSARCRGYVSRKNPEGIRKTYKGRYGTGYVVYRPAWDSTRFCWVDYHIDPSSK